jgi:hypothetical protein
MLPTKKKDRITVLCFAVRGVLLSDAINSCGYRMLVDE